MASFSSTDDRLPVAKARHTNIDGAHHLELSSRPAPHTVSSLCSPAAGATYVWDSSFLPQLSPPQGHRQRGHRKPYPSPPLTGSALRSTVPLPDIHGDFHSQFSSLISPEAIAHLDMTSEASCAHEPLSPPPTFLLGTLELPQTDPASCSTHVDSLPGQWPYARGLHDEGASKAPASKRRSYANVVASGSVTSHNGPSSKVPRVARNDSWEVQWGPQALDVVPEDMATAPHMMPSRIDSGFEEALPSEECAGDEPDHCDPLVAPYTVTEPASYWAPHSPISIHEPLSVDHLDEDLGDPGGSSLFSSPLLGFSQESTPRSWGGMDWSPSSAPESDYSPPSSPRPQSLSLDLPDLDHFGTSGRHLGFGFHDSPKQTLFTHDLPQDDSPWHTYHDIDFDMMDIDRDPPPSSPRPAGLLLPLSDPDGDSSFADTVMPPEDDIDFLHPSPSRRTLGALPDLSSSSTYYNDLCLTPIPRSPHSASPMLPDFAMDGQFEAPSPPSSPHLRPPSLPGDFSSEHAVETVAPSLLAPLSDGEGLGLFLNPVSVDPPLARSPSPDDDDLQFLDIQLDPASSNLEFTEFLDLRAVRRRALAAERAARGLEAELGERVSSAASALLPPRHGDAPADTGAGEKRQRKRELHAAMDMRAEARRVRKREKQRSKEVGALLDLKMDRALEPGAKGARSIAQLVAAMVLRRRDTFHPLAHRHPKERVLSPLLRSVSAEDLLADVDTDMDLDAEE